jgi:1-aminocyclopropane-1-carboxylate deaminase
MLRLDLVDPVVSGNKWYKLKYNLLQAKASGHTTVLSFGGAYSNHLVAAAAAAQLAGLKSIGIVRGLYATLTHTLRACADYGMQLQFVSYEDYKQKNDPVFLQQLSETYDHSFIIPEGGANEAGRKGAGEIAALIPRIYTHVCVSAGTGTTLAGLRNALPAAQFVVGFAPMKGGSYLQQELMDVIDPGKHKLFSVTGKYHFGGFGKTDETLLQFMHWFEKTYGFALDRVYTGKMMYGIREMLEQQAFGTHAKVLCIHTGGVQGNG